MALPQSQKRRRDLGKRDGEFCQNCGLPGDPIEDLTLGHIIPRSKGGRYTLENLRLLCPACNQAEGDEMPANLVDNIED